MLSNINNTKLKLDPRTKLLLLIAVNVITLSGGLSGVSGILRPLMAVIPMIFLIIEKKNRAVALYFLTMCLAIIIETSLLNKTTGALNLILLIISGLFSRFIPSLAMGYYLINTTSISEFIAAMERMYIPMKIIIPFAVMIRFLPTVKEENSAISDAMKMRGVRFGTKNAIEVLEYRVIPLLISTVKIGEELSASALTRGLGSPEKRTNICEIGFNIIDIFLMLLSAISLVLFFVF